MHAGSAVLLAATVRIYAAASLTDVLDDVIALFERAHPGVEVLPNFGGSSDLARQIVAGAPADLFFSADEAQMDRLEREGLLAEGSRRDVLSNQLVVVTHRSATFALEGPRDLKGLSGRIAMADPEAVPAGVYAREYLTKLGLWEEIRARVVPMLDVRAALAAAAGGNVEAAVVYRTDVPIEPRVRVRFEVPIDEGPRIAYPIAVVRGRTGDAVLAFASFLDSAPSRAVFERHGFLVLEER